MTYFLWYGPTIWFTKDSTTGPHRLKKVWPKIFQQVTKVQHFQKKVEHFQMTVKNSQTKTKSIDKPGIPEVSHYIVVVIHKPS